MILDFYRIDGEGPSVQSCLSPEIAPPAEIVEVIASDQTVEERPPAIAVIDLSGSELGDNFPTLPQSNYEEVCLYMFFVLL